MQAQQLNKEIFETIYYHALKASSDLAAKEGPYETYSGSPLSKVYQFERVFLTRFLYTYSHMHIQLKSLALNLGIYASKMFQVA